MLNRRPSLWVWVALGMAALALMPAVAFAAEKKGMSSEGIFVAELILLLVVGRGIGEVLETLGQPAVMGQLIGGILLGPSLLGWVWPEAERLIFAGDASQKSMINAIAQLGVLMLLLLTGMETDLRLVRRVGRACFSISAAGVAVPFALGFAAAHFMPDTLLAAGSERIVAGLFLGTALSISSVKIVAMVVRDMSFMRRNLGQVIVSSAIIEDTIGWVIVAITIGIATKGRVEIGSLAFTVLGVAAFMVFSFTLGRRIVFDAIRWTNDTFRSEYAVVTVILAIMGAMALITDLIGVHTVLGAFVAGILVGESPILSRHIEGQLRGIITALFMPVFFGVAGLSADLTVLIDPQLALLTVALVVIASIGKFGGAFIGAELAGMTRAEGIAVGCGMNARGSTEVIVASIGLSMGVLSHNLFTMIVTMAVITTLIMPPTLRWALRRLPMSESEKKRLEREEMDQRGFVANLERLLVVVDEGVVGRFAAYLAGVIGAGKPTTVLHSSGETEAEPTEGLHLEEIEKGAEDSREAAKKSDEARVRETPVSRRQHGELSAETVAREARKGYGMLLVGLGRAVTARGAFSHRLNEVTGAFDGPLCLVLKPASAGRQMPQLGPGSGKILVPVNGTAVARRGAELALAIAAVRSRAAAADAIARQAGRNAALIVMGVSRRQGEELIFGETTTGVLRRGPCPVVLISDERVKRDESDREAVRTGQGNG